MVRLGRERMSFFSGALPSLGFLALLAGGVLDRG